MSRTISTALLTLALSAAGVAHGATVEQQIATLKAVGPASAGSGAAREAWRQVSAAEAKTLPTILNALDDASPLAANWLRSSFDTIAERTLRTGGKLPATDLEKFALDTRHAPRARRLAFEWLCRADTTANDRLMPQLVDDPSVEMRRDAVARLISEAESQEAAGKGPEAAATYRRALTAARDLDQVQAIVKKLETFGDKVDLPAHFGFVVTWKLIGPFDNTDEKGFDVANPPENELNFTAEYPGKSGAVKWIEHTTSDPYGKVDMNNVLGKANAVTGYAAAEFMAAAARPVELRLASTNANKIWLNGKLIAQNNVYHAGEQLDQYVGKGELKPGKNHILVKILQNEQKESWAQDWNFQLRACDAAGTAILSTDRKASPVPSK